MNGINWEDSEGRLGEEWEMTDEEAESLKYGDLLLFVGTDETCLCKFMSLVYNSCSFVWIRGYGRIMAFNVNCMLVRDLIKE